MLDVLGADGRIAFKTFDDLEFDHGFDFRTPEGLKELYSREYASWLKAMRAGPPRIEIFLQHDSDSGPRETVSMVGQEAQRGIASTTSVFAQVIGEGKLLQYPIDFAALARFQNKNRLCVAYHCNAWETSRYDEALLAERFREDVQILRSQGLTIRCFSPHGGTPSPDKRNNNSFYFPGIVEEPLIWTHNTYAIKGHRYSDGGLPNRLARSDVTADLRAYLIENTGLARRIILLIHPQYYSATSAALAAKYFELNPWLTEYWRLYDSGRSAEFWAPLGDKLASV